ncbi:unnamed protein product [Durusdinium trenchii]|uniref:Uncharacterized protein n=2 Tax=Durusdinium trenchii TaxID=1381693 RepID=A0ABP0MTJ0_9DINO
MHHGWVLSSALCVALLVRGEEGQEGRKAWQLLWRADAAAAASDVTVVRARESRQGAGRLFFERQPRVRQAASSVFAFRRLLRESHHNLPPLQPEVHYDGSCVPRWPTNSSGLAFLLHISKSGGTALREVLQRGPGIAGFLSCSVHFISPVPFVELFDRICK